MKGSRVVFNLLLCVWVFSLARVFGPELQNGGKVLALELGDSVISQFGFCVQYFKLTTNGRRKSSSSVDLTDQIHQLPCCIKYGGPSPVSHYCKPKPTGVEVDGVNVKEAYFRGRKLQGTTVPLPDGYSGYVIGKKASGKRKASYGDEEMTDPWQMNAKFQNITFWNHDNLPSKEDAFLRAFHWFDVAKELHKPVTSEDVESASNPAEATATD